jgi:hypothetical protein
MEKVKHYGEVAEEKSVKEAIRAREITQEILNFGVNQYQIAKIIYLLSLELENREALRGIAEVLKPLLEDNSDKNSSIITT